MLGSLSFSRIDGLAVSLHVSSRRCRKSGRRRSWRLCAAQPCPGPDLPPRSSQVGVSEAGLQHEILRRAQELLDAANAKTAEYLAMAQRVQADFENFRRRNLTVEL